ncbi:MAG: methylglyoxal synthase [Bacteroidota bacterium]|nr:methylglyoxal synthase [Bacteroidota bacterium]
MRIAMIAHDGKKADMVSFMLNNKELFRNASLSATSTTGTMLEKAGFNITKYLSGPKGGDAQIAALVATGQIDFVFFFRDPLDRHPHEPDVQMLMRMCDVHNIPLATNPAAAKFLLKGMIADADTDI